MNKFSVSAVALSLGLLFSACAPQAKGTASPSGAVAQHRAPAPDAAAPPAEAVTEGPADVSEPAPEADEPDEMMAAPEPTRPAPRAELTKSRSRRGKDRAGRKAKRKRNAPLTMPAPAPIVADDEDADFAATATVARDPGNDSYERIVENDFVAVGDDPRSTFSIDVDTASYANVRRFLASGALPPPDAVRIEELVNYFEYAYPQPEGKIPFGIRSEVGPCPWNADHRLVHIGLQGKKISAKRVPPRNLVFLLDVSGSMEDRNKLPLLKRAMGMLVRSLRSSDRVSIVVYAGASGVVLPPTRGNRKVVIGSALDRLEAGGSTNGGQGIELAYTLAQRHFVRGGINRVILATDGDFNVGTTSHGDLTRLIEDKRRSGVFLSVLGVGTGNLKDSTMEMLADKGNGNYAYIDTLSEARKVLVDEASSTLVTIAKDVKIQVEFNPAEVASYRLIGYENRRLAHEDFNDDTKDAGEIGAGHTVTAIYEVVPVGQKADGKVDALRYRTGGALTAAAKSGEMLSLKIRYKRPDGNQSRLLSTTIRDNDRTFARTSNAYRFSAAVAEFGMLLRNSKHKGRASFDNVRRLAKGAMGSDRRSYRREFLKLVRRAQRLSEGGKPLRLAVD